MTDRHRSSARYRKHRKTAAIRRRRLVLLSIVLLSLGIVGGAMAWPKGDSAVETATDQAKAEATTTAKGKAKDQDRAQADATAQTDADAGESAEATDEIAPDYGFTPQAQKAIDTALANGRPPQFVVASFDGAADYRMYERWLAVADDVGARFTFFVSGIYMLLPEVAKREYQPPGQPAGFSNLGGYADLAGPKSARENLVDNINDFNRARRAGHEIGSHYVSHICEQANDWTIGDWVSEETQFERLMLQPSEVNGIDLPTPIYTNDDIHGGRTPCLAGNMANVYAAMKKMGFEYDSSKAGVLGQWPEKEQGLWNFPLPSIKRIGSEYPTMAMDYNFYVNHGPAETQAQAEEFESLTYRSYMGAIKSLYNGTRAPYITGSHFANWNKGAYMNALEQTLREACTMPEVACVTSIALARWLDAQRPAQLKKWRTGQWGKAAAANAG